VKLLLPTNVPLNPVLPEGVTAVYYDVAEPIPQEHVDAEAIVIWGSSARLLLDSARRLTRLRWIQSLAAGTDAIVAAGFTPDAVITSGRSLHDAPVTEHTLALILAAVRRLPELFEAHIAHRWAGEIGGLQPEYNPDHLTTLRGARVTVWGFGSIAAQLAPLLTALGAQVTGVARSPGERAGYPVIADSALEALLPETDLLVMILPGTPGNDGALSRERLALLSPRSWVVNVGRGSTVDEDALADALEAGALGGAAIDVTRVEPLPAESRLWSAPRLILTPHAAGGRPLGSDQLIAENAAALVAGTPLRNVVEG